MAPVKWRELKKNLVSSDLSNVASNPKKRRKSSKESRMLEKSVSTSVVVSETSVSEIPSHSVILVSTLGDSNVDISSSLLATTLHVHSTSTPTSTIEKISSNVSTTPVTTSPKILPTLTSFISLPVSAMSTLSNVEDSIRVTVPEFFFKTSTIASTYSINFTSNAPPLPRGPDFQSRAMLKRLEHTSGRPGMGSLWGLDFRPSDVLRDDFMEECDRQMMEQASMRDNFQSAEVFLLRTLGLLRHGASKYEECFAMARHTQSAVKKVMVLKESFSEEHSKCVDMLLAFSTAIKSNSTLSEKVDLLLSRFRCVKEQGDDLFDKLMRADAEKKVTLEKLLEVSDNNSKLVEDNSVLQAENIKLKSVEEEISRLRAENEMLKRMQAEKDELINTVISRLGQFDVDMQSKFEGLDISMEKLDSQIKDLQDAMLELKKLNEEKNMELLEARTRVVVEHKKGFEKAVRQTFHFYPEIDIDKFHLFKDVFEGELVNESELEDEDEE